MQYQALFQDLTARLLPYHSSILVPTTHQIQSVLNMIIDNRYTELKSDIERQQKQVQNKKDSEKLYKEAEKLYNSNHINYERIIELLESANKKYQIRKEYCTS